jgi:hypothetical protein
MRVLPLRRGLPLWAGTTSLLEILPAIYIGVSHKYGCECGLKERLRLGESCQLNIGSKFGVVRGLSWLSLLVCTLGAFIV